jgi:hypothetical protein
VADQDPKKAAKFLSLQESIKKANQEQVRILRESENATGQTLKNLEAQFNKQEQIRKAAQKNMEYAQGFADASANANKYQQMIADNYKDIFKASGKVEDIQKAIVEAEAELVSSQKAGNKLIAAGLKERIASLKISKDSLKVQLGGAKAFGAINDQIGAGVDGLVNFVNALPGGGMLVKMFGLDKLKEQITAAIGQALLMNTTMGGGLKGAAAGARVFGTALYAALGPVTLIAAAVIGLVMVFKQISKQAKELSKDTGLTYSQSKLLVKEANKQVASGSNQLSLQKDILAVQKESVKEFGALGMLTGKQAGDVSDIGIAFGYGAEQAGKVNAAFMSMGVSADDAANAQRDLAAESLKAGVNVGQVTADIMDNSKATAKYFGGNVKALKKAAIEAAKMGVSLATMVKVSDSLLDFETSISSQFELQSLTGKQMNFDLARQLALEGDIAGATKAVMDQVGSIHDFNKMDVLERKKLAEATGMDVSELQKSLTIKDKLGNLTADELTSMNALGLSASEMADMSSEDLQNRLAQQKASERTAASFAAMKAQLVNALLPAGEALMNIFSMLSPVLKIIGVGLKIAFMPLTLAGKAMGALIGFMEKFKGITAGVLTLTTLIIAKKKEEAIMSAVEIGRATALNTLKTIRVALENASLTAMISQGATTAKNLAKTAMEGAMVLGKAIAGLFGSFAQIPFGIGIPLAIAAAGGLFAMFNKATAVGDLGIDPNGGPIVSSPTVGGIFQGDKRDGLSMGPGMGTSPSAGGAGVVNNYYGEKDDKGVTMQQVIDAISNISINMDGKELSATIRTADSFRRG